MVMRMVTYRTDFFFWSFVSLMWTVFNFFFFKLLIGVNDNIAGWTEMELYVVLAIYTIVDAFTWSWFASNMHTYKNHIYSGELSDLLVKPVNTIFIVLTQRNSYDNAPRLLIGVFVLFWALRNLQISPSVGQIALFSVLIITSLIFLYTGWFVTATIAFWLERVKNITEIMPAFRRIYEFPRSIYTGIASFIFTTLFPLALITTLPSRVLLATPNWSLIGYFILFTAGFVLFAIWFFKISLKRYSSVGH